MNPAFFNGHIIHGNKVRKLEILGLTLLQLGGDKFYHRDSMSRQSLSTVKLPAVDWSTIQFWNFLAKGHST